MPASGAAPSSPAAVVVVTGVTQDGAAPEVDEAATNLAGGADKGYTSGAEGDTDDESELPLEDSPAAHRADPPFASCLC